MSSVPLNVQGNLVGKNAVELHRQGMKAWNLFMKGHPNVTAIFEGDDFEKDSELIDFRGFYFPNGLSITHMDLGDSTLDFTSAIFEQGDVLLDRVQINRRIDFSEATFERCNCKITDLDAPNAKIFFIGTKLTTSEVRFMMCRLGQSLVNISHLQSDLGQIHFTSTELSKTSLLLDDMTCDVLAFYNVFGGTRSPKASLSIKRSIIRVACDLSKVDFRCFDDVSLRGSHFESLLDLTESRFSVIPDLTSTSISNHLSLDSLQIERADYFKKGDSTKARRLKELAKKSEDRQTELNMLALELDAQNATKEIPGAAILLNKTYRFISDYGRSILRPSLLLLGTLVCSAVLYWGISAYFPANNTANQTPTQSSSTTSQTATKGQKAIDAFLLATSQTLPFLSWSRTVKDASIQALYGGKENLNEYPLLKGAGLVQSFFSYLSLFFIGLGIRNRYKL